MAIFSREQIIIRNARTTRRRVFSGYGGYTEAEVSIPHTITPEQRGLLKAEHLSATIHAPVNWVDGRAPRKADPIWGVSAGNLVAYGKIVAVNKTYKEAIAIAADWVYSANPSEGGEA